MKKIVTLREQDIRQMVGELLMEARQPKHVYYDYYDTIAPHLKDLTGTDEFYFVQAIKRKKDQIHANFNYAQYLGYWKVKNAAELKAIKPDYMALSKKENARIYIRLNPRNEAFINNDIQNAVKVRNLSQRDQEILFQKLAGRKFDGRRFTKQFPITMVDIDTDNQKAQEVILDYIKKQGVNVMFTYKTPNGGMHVLCDGRDVVNVDFSIFDSGKHLGHQATAAAVIDGATNLFGDITVLGY